MKLEDIKQDSLIQGIEPGKNVRIVRVEKASTNSISIIYESDNGETIKKRMLFREDEDKYSPATDKKYFSFKGNPDEFKLALEAKRISNAHLFDPFMAVHSSNVIPLPHQITAVYESMLPKQPLRYILADDPGAGKTIMAGLLIRELIARADIERILIVCPGSLVEQWQDELDEKFNLQFRILSNELHDQCRGNVFEEYPCLVARIDQLKRMVKNEETGDYEKGELRKKLDMVEWDLVIVDEAHKMSAHQYGSKVSYSQRFELGKSLSAKTKHFLLMTATPHNGNEGDFQEFLSLLDGDRFGKMRGNTEKVDVSDIMRRMCKEDLLKFDGTHLFPERIAWSAGYDLSDMEMDLYEKVTAYVREEMNKAERMEGNKKVNVGFALTNLQRRLASSPEAIHKSLKSRRLRLMDKRKEWAKPKTGYVSEVMASYSSSSAKLLEKVYEYDDDFLDADYEENSAKITDRATASRSLQELDAEIAELKSLEEMAHRLVLSGKDKKWDQLRNLLENTPQMQDEEGSKRKLIIFTEYKATLDYLQDRIGTLLGDPGKVVVIHGGIKREERRRVQEEFKHNPDIRILIATDAAGEGVNLQTAHLMINYDLPWNPNRIEQRFGRIHRIGQTEVCYLWNMIANNTREGIVFAKLFEKLEEERNALGGKVFDVLGELFEDKSLQELLLDAIRYGEDPQRKKELQIAVEGALDTNHIKNLITRNALTQDIMSPERMFSVREEMEKAEARKLQPHFVKSYFMKAFETVGGFVNPRERERYQISHVPETVIQADKVWIGAERKNRNPVVRKYERVCFDREYVDVNGKKAELLHPGHPLMTAVTSCVLGKYEGVLKQGSVFVDDADAGIKPHVLCVLDHQITDYSGSVLSRRFQFVWLDDEGLGANAGFAPHLDLREMTAEEKQLIVSASGSGWLDDLSSVCLKDQSLAWAGGNVEAAALSYATEYLVPEHYRSVRDRRLADIEKTMLAVRKRLTAEIDHLTKLRKRFEGELQEGKPMAQANLDRTKQDINRIRERLEAKERELELSRDVVSQAPVVVGACLVLPKGLLDSLGGKTDFSTDSESRKYLEQCGMQAVFEKEQAMGYVTTDVSKDNCGWDITSIKYAADGSILDKRHIEVKGKSASSDVVTVSSNEIRAAFNIGEKYALALVVVDGDVIHPPRYIHKPFDKEPDWETVSVNLDVKKLLEKSEEF